MKAINRYIIVDRIKTEPKKVAGLIMTDDTDVDNRYLKAKIISCGNLVEGLNDGDVIRNTLVKKIINAYKNEYSDNLFIKILDNNKEADFYSVCNTNNCMIKLFEFWLGDKYRIHERLKYNKVSNNWKKEILYP